MYIVIIIYIYIYIYYLSLACITTREQAGTPEWIREDPTHWQLASEERGHSNLSVALREDFAAYAGKKAQKAKAWRNERATWLKEQSEALSGKGHGKKGDDGSHVEDGTKSKGNGKGTKKKKGDDMEVDNEEEGAQGWGARPKEAQPRTNRAEKGSSTGKGKHTCIHCGVPIQQNSAGRTPKS